ncbi:hypothetical protein AAHA92_15381 [Salvia divinorum]|uniref:Myb/SANT-like domain-containing protein n=1 Tax=Salvia divinorum TaxID=28513 RepID=A0ABD1HHV9_SALDI
MAHLLRSDFGPPLSNGRPPLGNRRPMGNGCETHGQEPRQSKADRSRRSWSGREEVFLLVTLKDLVARGWKSDNGFRGGYQLKIEESMRQEFPATDLKANPHIMSKIHTWKKNYGSLSQILSSSGVGFNINGDYKIDVDDQQWGQILKTDPSLRGLRHKSWPYYEDWKLVFGKDRATGLGAEDMVDAADEVDGAPHEETTDSVYSSAQQSSSAGVAGKKQKGRDALDDLIEVIGKMHQDTNARLQYLATRIGYEFDLTKARKEVFELVGVIPGLSLEQVLDASEIILAKVERLDFFMSLPEGARQVYVYRALEKQNAM